MMERHWQTPKKIGRTVKAFQTGMHIYHACLKSFNRL